MKDFTVMFSNVSKKIKLRNFNRKFNCSIKSLDVSLRAEIGTQVRVGFGSYIDSKCKIGNYTYFGRNCNVTRATIGAYCSIANNVSIGQGEHSLDRISTSSLFYEESYNKLTKGPCVIGHDVWIGSDAIILRDVTVGNGAVIGANAVVTKDVKDFEVVVGVPAKHLKFRFSEAEQTAIVKSGWWNQLEPEARYTIARLELK